MRCSLLSIASGVRLLALMVAVASTATGAASVTISLPAEGVKKLQNGNTIDAQGYVRDAAGTVLGRVLDSGAIQNSVGSTANDREKEALVNLVQNTPALTSMSASASANTSTESVYARTQRNSYNAANDSGVTYYGSAPSGNGLLPKPNVGERLAVGDSGYHIDSDGRLYDAYSTYVGTYNFSTGVFTKADDKHKL